MEKLKKRSERFGCATSPVITGVGTCVFVHNNHALCPTSRLKTKKRKRRD